MLKLPVVAGLDVLVPALVTEATDVATGYTVNEELAALWIEPSEAVRV